MTGGLSSSEIIFSDDTFLFSVIVDIQTSANNLNNEKK